MRHAAGDQATGGSIGVGSVLLGMAMLGSLVLLGALGGSRGRAPGSRRLAAQTANPEPDPVQRPEPDGIPVLTDVVDGEALQRPVAEPPLLTDEVLPGRQG
jgi:hypothetical protein